MKTQTLARTAIALWIASIPFSAYALTGDSKAHSLSRSISSTFMLIGTLAALHPVNQAAFRKRLD